MITSFAHDVLQPLVRGTSMERAAAREALTEILEGRVDAVLVASFLTAVTCKGETRDEMTGFVDAMMAAATRVTVPANALDIVGTGGDQLHTVNVSTMAALTVAGCGVPVAKHGNRAASSSVGSADVLEALGVRLDVDVATISHCLAYANMAFLFAPTYHHALRYLTPIRRTLSFRSVFNVLGPLANPAQVQRTLIGVAQEALMDDMAHVLSERGVVSATLVRGSDGLDELSLGAPSTLIDVRGSDITHSVIDAGGELGRPHDVREIAGGQTNDNVTVVRQFLDGSPGAVFDVVCANAGLALVVAGVATNLVEGFEMASQSVVSGAASAVLDRLVEATSL